MKIPRVLIIAGSDSGGGAGIQADLKTVSALGGYGMTAITAITAQNTSGVYGVVDIAPDFVAQQIEAVVTDIGVDATKIGMLSNGGIIHAVAAKVKERQLHPLVVDPVMIAKSGAPLLNKEAIEALKKELMPLASVITPNLYEASALWGQTIQTVEDAKQAAVYLQTLGARSVIVKGGDKLGDESMDVFYDGKDFTILRAEKVAGGCTHGSGCAFASAIATWLARGVDVPHAVAEARQFITIAIRHGLPLGQGRCPVDPMAQIRIRLDL